MQEQKEQKPANKEVKRTTVGNRKSPQSLKSGSSYQEEGKGPDSPKKTYQKSSRQLVHTPRSHAMSPKQESDEQDLPSQKADIETKGDPTGQQEPDAQHEIETKEDPPLNEKPSEHHLSNTSTLEVKAQNQAEVQETPDLEQVQHEINHKEILESPIEKLQPIQEEPQVKVDEEEKRSNEAPSQVLEVVDPKYGDQQIDLSQIQKQQNDQQTVGELDSARPTDLAGHKRDPNEPLPSNTNKVSMGEFSVGNFKEFQLREQLASLIDKYNKKFYVGGQKPNLTKESIRGTKYQDKMITNPVAVPDPGSTDHNYSWMYLMTPYYNQMTKEFNQQLLENNVLKQHSEYFIDMEKEKDMLSSEFDNLKSAERHLAEQIKLFQNENDILENKAQAMERNVTCVRPQRVIELSDKLGNMNNILQGKDSAIDQLLIQIGQVKNEKDDLQNAVLFKKQRIDTLNIEHNTKELEYQRLWEEGQDLKSEIRGETTDSQQVKRENDRLQRDILSTKDESIRQEEVYQQFSSKIQDVKAQISDFENRLRYANDVIINLEGENQQVELDVAQARATIEGQSKAYNEMKNHFYMLSQNGDAKMSGGISTSTFSPIISIPKVVMPSSYYKPSPIVNRASINLMPSTSKALTQSVAPSNIKSYLSGIKKTNIDLTSDFVSPTRNIDSRGLSQKVRFSSDQKGLQRATDPFDTDFDMQGRNDGTFSENKPNRRVTVNNMQSQAAPRVNSVNRNFVDTMSSIMGVSESTQNAMKVGGSSEAHNFPLRKRENSITSPQKQINRESILKGSPQVNLYNQETDVSTEYGRNTEMSMNGARMSNYSISSASPYKQRGTQRQSQPQQLNSNKQRQFPQSTRAQQIQGFEKFREPTWQERMSQLPKQSAYRSSLTFGSDGISADVQASQPQRQFYEQPPQQLFSMAQDYDIDINGLNESDPKAKQQIINFKQQKVYGLQDERKLLQQQFNQIPENAKLGAKRQQRQELDNQITNITKRISTMKYDLKKLSSKVMND